MHSFQAEGSPVAVDSLVEAADSPGFQVVSEAGFPFRSRKAVDSPVLKADLQADSEADL